MRIRIMTLMLAVSVFASGCSDNAPVVRVALLPILDSLPGYIAAESGYYEDRGVSVEIIPVNSALDRDQMMQAGEIDLMLAELSTTAVFNADSPRLKTIATVRRSDKTSSLFKIIAGRDSGIGGPEELKGRGIAVGENTVTEYVAYRMLQKLGLRDSEVNFSSIPVIPERFSLLMAGRIDAAILPDPLATAAISAGNRLIADDSVIPALSMSVLTASGESLKDRRNQIEAFLAAWDAAVDDINKHPDAALAFYMASLPAPEGLEEYFSMPRFPPAQVPTEEAWNDMLGWLMMKGIIDKQVDYSESVTPEYLPVK